MVEEVMREFVPAALAADLDFSGARRVNSKFHPDRRSAVRRESDVIWELPARTGTGSSLYLLIEFQSASDRWMAVRTQVYQGLLWQQVIREQELKSGAGLPPVLLLVLYNGEEPWNAPTDVTELIELKSSSALWYWQPQVRYYLLDMRDVAEEALLQSDSLVALLFRLERARPESQLTEVTDEVVDWFRRHEDFLDLKPLFAELAHKVFRNTDIRVPLSEDLLEMMKSNLLTLHETWKAQWFAEAEAIAVVKGKAEGKTEGKAEALESLLISRFGRVPASIRERIHEAALASLDSWFDRALNASDLPSVFDQPR
jgi:hypothetical protein